MILSFIDLNPIIQALLATAFTWFVTAVGASLVFLLKDINRKFFDGMLRFAAGVLLAASYWSLLSPSLELSKLMSLLQVAIGFLLEGISIRIVNKILLHLHTNLLHPSIAGRKTKLKKIY